MCLSHHEPLDDVVELEQRSTRLALPRAVRTAFWPAVADEFAHGCVNLLHLVELFPGHHVRPVSGYDVRPYTSLHLTCVVVLAGGPLVPA